MRKTVEAAFDLLEEMANNNCLWPSERFNPPKQGGKIGVDMVTSLQAQIASFSKQLGDLSCKTPILPSSSQLSCEHCHMLGHLSNDCTMMNYGMLRENGME